MIGFRKGILSLRGRPIARVSPIDDKPETILTVENVMRRGCKLYNAASNNPDRRYFQADTSIEDRFYHAGMAVLIVILLAAGLWSASWAGFVAFGLLALALHWMQPAR